jgi:hypothetical protein
MVRRIVLIGILGLLMVSGAAVGLAAPAASLSDLRAAAQKRWQGQPISGYRATVQIERPDDLCLQELEVRGSLVNVVRDTCRPSWLSRMTVSRLFELSQRLDLPSECFPSNQDCSCRRVRIGQAVYDEQLGYPLVLEWRRELQPYWQHIDYWGSVLSKGALPSCGPAVMATRVVVLSLTPMS